MGQKESINMLEIAVYSELEQDTARDQELICAAAHAAFGLFDYPFEASVDVTLTDDEGIREVNRNIRGIDRATDVLSFPMLDFYRGQYNGQREIDGEPETGELFLGDVLISLERACAQAEEYGHSRERECAYLTVHSLLHLLGYDHVDEGPEKAAMREKEEQALALLGLKREEQVG